MKLYYAPGTRAARPRWLLEELEVPYELVTVDLEAGAHRRPEYLAVHPLGRVPALADGELRLLESVAICVHLADRFRDRGLMPEPGSPERALVTQWLLFATTELDGSLDLISLHSADLPDGERVPAIVPWARARFSQGARVLDDAVGGRRFLVGDRLTAADVVLGCLLSWADRARLLGHFPELARYREDLLSRPAARRALAGDRPC